MDWKTTIISSMIAIVVAAISGWISAKQSYAKEIQKSIYKERENLYVEMFRLLEQLQKSPVLLYNTKDFINPLREMNARVNLYASKEVLGVFNPFYNRILTIWNKYTDLYDSEKAETELSNRKALFAEEGNESSERIEYEFVQDAELFMENNLIVESEIADILNRLATQIRAELKTK